MYQEKYSFQDKSLPQPSRKPKRKLLLALAAAIIVAGSAWFIGGGNTGLFIKKGDVISSSERQARQDTFNAIKVFPLSEVRESEIDAALRSMNLSESERNALIANLNQGKNQPPAASDVEVEQSTLQKDHPQDVDRLLPQTAAKPSENAIKLAWLTLWDSDVEDGDVVRIDSQGYSRMVYLTKAPVTFAVPIPSSGIINVTGIRDGDGGGITAGIASGSSKVILPVMSVGQVLGLKVKGN